MQTCDYIELAPEDLGGRSREELACSDCIKGYCPSRTVAMLEEKSFIFCGARQIAAAVLDSYRARTGCSREVQRPD